MNTLLSSQDAWKLVEKAKEIFLKKYKEKRQKCSYHNLSSNDWRYFPKDFKCNYHQGSMRDIIKYTKKKKKEKG